MAEFDASLHGFLLENELCMSTEKGILYFGVHVEFEEIPKLIKLLGEHVLDDGGITCNLSNNQTLYIPLEEYFLNCDYTIADYKDCFNTWDIENYATQIELFDNQNE